MTEAPRHAGFIVQHRGKLERIVAWKGEQVVAGRAADCDIVLGIDEVSRRHARFERAGDRFEVCDLGSVNGTFVDSYRVAGERELPTGATLRIGAVEMIFRSFIAGVEAPPPTKSETGIVSWVKRLFRAPPSESRPHR